ncbi:hypothetical protein GCM10020331_024120 [Ectobacillus funiculus]
MISYDIHPIKKWKCKKIVALGDSVTYGVGASPEGNDHLNHSWVGLLQNYVGSNVKGIRNVKIVNKGFPGHTTSQLLKEKSD